MTTALSPTAATMEEAGLIHAESTEDIARTVVQHLKRRTQAAAVFAAIPRGSRTYAIAVREGLTDPRWEQLGILPGRGLGGKVLDTRRGALVTDYRSDPTITGHYRTVVGDEGLQSVGCVPVLGATGVAALLYVAERRDGKLSSRLLDEMRSTAELTGVLLAMAAQHTTHVRRLDTVSRIARSSAGCGDDPGQLRQILDRIQTAADGRPHHLDTEIRLTPRETDVLELLADGASNRAIASRLVLSETTIKGYIHTLINKFAVGSRLEIVAAARRRGMV